MNPTLTDLTWQTKDKMKCYCFKPYHFLDGRLEEETVTITQPTSSIVAWEPSELVRISEWSLILAFFLTGKTSTISFLLFCSAANFIIVSLGETLSDSNTHITPWNQRQAFWYIKKKTLKFKWKTTAMHRKHILCDETASRYFFPNDVNIVYNNDRL